MYEKHININWQRLLLNLRRVKSLTKIAKDTGADPQTLNRLARGDTQEPKFNTGLKLINMHLDECGTDKHKKLCL